MADKKKKKKEREEKIETAEVLGDIAEEAGVEDVVTGMEDLAAAGELEEVSKEALVEGAAEVTAGMDDLASAERVAFLSGVVAGAGVTDLKEGADLLTTADNVELVSALVGIMGAADLEYAMELAGVAGQIMVAGDVVKELDMLVLSLFLAGKGDQLRDLAFDSIFPGRRTARCFGRAGGNERRFNRGWPGGDG